MAKSVPSAPSPESAHVPATEPNNALAAFHARLESGRFHAVLGRALRRTIHDAATNPSLDAEVGAIRLALARLLTEERDPSRLATGVARLVAVAVQAARLRQPPDGELDELRAAIAQALDEYEAELAAEQAAKQHASPLALPVGDWDEPAAPASADPFPSIQQSRGDRWSEERH